MKILIVDDEIHIRKSMKRFFSLSGHTVTTAENGLSAKKKLEGEFFDAAVIDLKMPGMSGMELLCWISEQGLNLPTIIISAFGQIEDAVEAMKGGAVDYLTKPFDPGELEIRLKKIVEAHRMSHQIEAARRGGRIQSPPAGHRK